MGLLVDHRLSAIEQLALLAGLVTGQHSFELLGQLLFRGRSRADGDPMVRAFSRTRDFVARGLRPLSIDGLLLNAGTLTVADDFACNFDGS
jgi:hypothetical protein